MGIGVFSFILLPLSLAFHLFGIKVANVLCGRVGHLALEPWCLLQRQIQTNSKYRLIILAKRGEVANRHF